MNLKGEMDNFGLLKSANLIELSTLIVATVILCCLCGLNSAIAVSLSDAAYKYDIPTGLARPAIDFSGGGTAHILFWYYFAIVTNSCPIYIFGHLFLIKP